MPTPSAPSGLVLLNKPCGQSSHATLKHLKAQHGGRVGHGGTLDPFADGLMVALCGALTRLSTYVSAWTKEYIATVLFGYETDTLDLEGEPCREAPCPTLSALRAALAHYSGDYLQHPPRYSAKHVRGVRAYTLARQGVTFNLAPKRVAIYSLSLIYYDPPYAQIAVRCGTGTYIRSLARDIAVHCNSAAHLVALRRCRVAHFTSYEAVDPTQVNISRHLITPLEMCRRLPGVYPIFVQPAYEAAVRTGVRLVDSMTEIPTDTTASNAGGRVSSHTAERTAHHTIYLVFNRRREMVAACRRDAPQRYSYIFVVP